MTLSLNFTRLTIAFGHTPNSNRRMHKCFIYPPRLTVIGITIINTWLQKPTNRMQEMPLLLSICWRSRAIITLSMDQWVYNLMDIKETIMTPAIATLTNNQCLSSTTTLSKSFKDIVITITICAARIIYMLQLNTNAEFPLACTKRNNHLLLCRKSTLTTSSILRIGP